LKLPPPPPSSPLVNQARAGLVLLPEFHCLHQKNKLTWVGAFFRLDVGRASVPALRASARCSLTTEYAVRGIDRISKCATSACPGSSKAQVPEGRPCVARHEAGSPRRPRSAGKPTEKQRKSRRDDRGFRKGARETRQLLRRIASKNRGPRSQFLLDNDSK
jgi:hypothetical protein